MQVVVEEETISYARGSVPIGEEGEPGDLVRINAVTNALKDLGALRYDSFLCIFFFHFSFFFTHLISSQGAF